MHNVILGIFFGLLESTALILVCLSLLGLKWHSFRVVLAAVVECAVLFIVRILPLSFGTHTIVSIITLAILMRWVFQQPLEKSLLGVCPTFILLIVFEGLGMALLTLVGLDLKDPIGWFVSGLPHVLALVAVGSYIQKRRPEVLDRLFGMPVEGGW